MAAGGAVAEETGAGVTIVSGTGGVGRSDPEAGAGAGAGGAAGTVISGRFGVAAADVGAADAGGAGDAGAGDTGWGAADTDAAATVD